MESNKKQILETLKAQIRYIDDYVKDINNFPNMKSKYIENYYEAERNLNFYLSSLSNHLVFNIHQIKFLKNYIRQRLYESYSNSEDVEARLQKEKLINEIFRSYVENIKDTQDIKFLFGTQFSYSNLNSELMDIEQLTSILKAMENALFSEIKSNICSRLNVDSIPLFLIKNSKKLLKQKVRRLWRINYEIPVNNLKLESKFGYKFLNEKFLDLINERFNLFDSNYLDEETRLILFNIFIYSNLEYLNSNDFNIQSFLNNSKKYIFLMGLDKNFEEITNKITNILTSNLISTSYKSDLSVLNENLKLKLKNDFNLLQSNSDKPDKEKILIIIFSFSIMLNNLMTFHIDTDNNNNVVPKIVFSSELKCSARERQFLINLLTHFDFYILTSYDTYSNPNSVNKFSSLKINYMLENSIFSSLIKSYTQIIFDEEFNKTKVNFNQKEIFSHFENTCGANTDLQKMNEIFHKFLVDEVTVKIKHDSKIKQVASTISNKFKFLYKKIGSKISDDITDPDKENDNKINVNLSSLKIIPFDPINISSHICLCINGHILEGDIEKLWQSFTINEKSVDYYFFHWREQNFNNNFLSDAMIFYNKFKNNLSYDEAKESNNKIIFRRNKKISKIFGKILAFILASRCIFKFHVISLIGYSLGCNVIKHCIIELNKIFDYYPEVNEIIQNIVFIGGATKLSPDKFKYEEFFKIIAGRIVNTYSTFDKTLADIYSNDSIGLHPLLYEGKRLQIENYDLSGQKINHDDYKKELGIIIDHINIL